MPTGDDVWLLPSSRQTLAGTYHQGRLLTTSTSTPLLPTFQQNSIGKKMFRSRRILLPDINWKSGRRVSTDASRRTSQTSVRFSNIPSCCQERQGIANSHMRRSSGMGDLPPQVTQCVLPQRSRVSTLSDRRRNIWLRRGPLCSIPVCTTAGVNNSPTLDEVHHNCLPKGRNQHRSVSSEK
jgi:hypothetical protein